MLSQCCIVPLVVLYEVKSVKQSDVLVIHGSILLIMSWFFIPSFHVGSGCYDATAFSAAVASARTVFDMGEEEGFHFELLDIGGGFPGQKSSKISFEEVNSWTPCFIFA